MELLNLVGTLDLEFWILDLGSWILNLDGFDVVKQPSNVELGWVRDY